MGPGGAPDISVTGFQFRSFFKNKHNDQNSTSVFLWFLGEFWAAFLTHLGGPDRLKLGQVRSKTALETICVEKR